MNTFTFTRKTGNKINNKTHLVYFVHVPRTGGTAIVMNLLKNSVKNDNGIVQNMLLKRKDNNFIRLLHIGHQISTMCPKEAFKFAFVRDPLKRFLSAFSYLSEGGKNNPVRPGAEIWAMKQLKKYKIKTPTDLINSPEWIKNKLFELEHFKPLKNYICDEQGNINVDFIGDTDNMEEDINKLCKILDLKQIKIKKENQSKSKFTLTTKDKQFLREYYKKDFEIYESIL